MSKEFIIFCIILILLLLLYSLLRRLIVIAQPDEWLLCIRNGKPCAAGIGIRLIRRPGDVVARFTSTVQRVRFEGEMLTADRVQMRLEGFILWSIALDSEQCFRAFQRLGIVNLNKTASSFISRQHLLSMPQHKAFKQLLLATLQRLVSGVTMNDLMGKQDDLVQRFWTRLKALQEEMGIEIRQVEIINISPTEESLISALSANTKEQIREEAEKIRLQTAEKVTRFEIDSQERLAKDRAEIKKHEAEREHHLRLTKANYERETKLREQETLKEEKLAAEKTATAIAKTALEREEMKLQARLDRLKREAETEGMAIESVAQAQENKSLALRQWELSKLSTEKTAEAISKLQLNDARWISIGNDSPVAHIGGIITAAQEIISAHREK